MEKASAEVLKQMQAKAEDPWFAYQNMAMDSSSLGHLKFLCCGENSTFKFPPKVYPDTPQAINWPYQFVGMVNLDDGHIMEMDWPKKYEADYVTWREASASADQGDTRV